MAVVQNALVLVVLLYIIYKFDSLAHANANMDFGDLKGDSKIQTKITNLHNSIEKIDNILSLLINSDAKEKLSLKEQTDYDLFMAYTLNTLYWIYLRTKGVDPNTNEVKNQLNRVKEYMIKAKQVLTFFIFVFGSVCYVFLMFL